MKARTVNTRSSVTQTLPLLVESPTTNKTHTNYNYHQLHTNGGSSNSEINEEEEEEGEKIKSLSLFQRCRYLPFCIKYYITSSSQQSATVSLVTLLLVLFVIAMMNDDNGAGAVPMFQDNTMITIQKHQPTKNTPPVVQQQQYSQIIQNTFIQQQASSVFKGSTTGMMQNKNIKKNKPQMVAVSSKTIDFKRNRSEWVREEVVLLNAVAVYQTFRQIDSAMMTNPEYKPRSSRSGLADPFEEGNCVKQHDWQMTSFPSCNKVHETNLADPVDPLIRLINNGYWRDVWKVQDVTGDLMVMKMMRYEHAFTERNYERHRRDAVAMERLTGSPYVVDIYGFCGNSGYFEYSSGGDINSLLWGKKSKDISFLEALKISEEVALGLAAVHTVEGDEHAPISHTDITPSQYILIDGQYKLNDFNRSRFIRWNKQTQETCPFHVGNNPGKFRSPEEYAYELETEKIDVYSMGNIIYALTTGYWPFDYEKYDDKTSQKTVMSGGRPHVQSGIVAERNKNPAIAALLKAIDMCWVQNPKERAKAKDVAVFIRQRLNEIENQS